MASRLRHRTTPQPEPSQRSVSDNGIASPYIAYDGPSDHGGMMMRRRNSMPSVFAPSGSTANSNNSSWNFSDAGGNHTVGGLWTHKLALVSGLLLLAAPWIHHSSTQWKAASLQDELLVLQKDQRMLQNTIRSQTEILKQIEDESKTHKKKNKKLLSKLKAYGSDFEDFDSEHYEEAEEIENAYLKRIDSLQEEVKRSSERKLVSAGFRLLGSAAPIRVEFTLDKDVGEAGNKFVIELGPVNMIPHTIEFFLMLIEDKQYYKDLTLMHRNAGSTSVYTVPLDRETMEIANNDFMHQGRPPEAVAGEPDSLAAFQKEDNFILHQLAMLDHADGYEIEKYSVLFIDHGPHFYINMEDSRPNKKDVCFGKVIEGQAVIDYIVSHESDFYKSKFMVGIESVKVIQPKEKERTDHRRSSRSRNGTTNKKPSLGIGNVKF